MGPRGITYMLQIHSQKTLGMTLTLALCFQKVSIENVAKRRACEDKKYGDREVVV